MTLRELENILINISVDASLMMNTQHSMIISATMNMIKSVENLANNIQSCPLHDSCKNMMMQKMTELDSYTSQAILMRCAEMGIDIGMYGGYMNSSTVSPMMPRMQMPQMHMMPQMMPMQPMMPPQQHFAQPQMAPPQPPPMEPVSMPATPPPIATPPPPPVVTATVTPAPPPPPPPAAPVAVTAGSNSGSTAISMGGALPGMGGGNDAPAEGRDYLLKIINGEG